MSKKFLFSLVATVALVASSASAQSKNSGPRLRELICKSDGKAYEQLISIAAGEALSAAGFSNFKVTAKFREGGPRPTTTLPTTTFNKSQFQITADSSCNNGGENQTQCAKKIASFSFDGIFPQALGTCSIPKKLDFRVVFKNKKTFRITQNVTIPGAFVSKRGRVD